MGLKVRIDATKLNDVLWDYYGGVNRKYVYIVVSDVGFAVEDFEGKELYKAIALVLPTTPNEKMVDWKNTYCGSHALLEGKKTFVPTEFDIRNSALRANYKYYEYGGKVFETESRKETDIKL